MATKWWLDGVIRVIDEQNFSEAKIEKGVGVVEIILHGDRIDDFNAFTEKLPPSFVSLSSVKNEELVETNCKLIITERPGRFCHPSGFYGILVSLFISLFVKYWDLIYEYVSAVVYKIL